VTYLRHTTTATTIGELTLVGSDDDLVGVYFPHHWYPPAPGTIGLAVALDRDDLLVEAARQIDQYLAGARQGFHLPLRTSGSAFEQSVWALLAEIPYGSTTTYGALAARLGDAGLARMVGRAVGRNRLSIVIACHRVVGKNGSLTGYAGGLERKRRLLELEQPRPDEVGRLF
jgi:methylated-DNA-[protein]-cysteine S-methyltransferase